MALSTSTLLLPFLMGDPLGKNISPLSDPIKTMKSVITKKESDLKIKKEIIVLHPISDKHFQQTLGQESSSAYNVINFSSPSFFNKVNLRKVEFSNLIPALSKNLEKLKQQLDQAISIKKDMWTIQKLKVQIREFQEEPVHQKNVSVDENITNIVNNSFEHHNHAVLKPAAHGAQASQTATIAPAAQAPNLLERGIPLDTFSKAPTALNQPIESAALDIQTPLNEPSVSINPESNPLEKNIEIPAVPVAPLTTNTAPLIVKQAVIHKTVRSVLQATTGGVHQDIPSVQTAIIKSALHAESPIQLDVPLNAPFKVAYESVHSKEFIPQKYQSELVSQEIQTSLNEPTASKLNPLEENSEIPAAPVAPVAPVAPLTANTTEAKVEIKTDDIRGHLLSEIQKGTQLKKILTQAIEKKEDNDVLSQIKTGIKLKKIEPATQAKKVDTILDNLAKTFDNFQNKNSVKFNTVNTDDSTVVDEESDDDWETPDTSGEYTLKSVQPVGSFITAASPLIPIEVEETTVTSPTTDTHSANIEKDDNFFRNALNKRRARIYDLNDNDEE